MAFPVIFFVHNKNIGQRKNKRSNFIIFFKGNYRIQIKLAELIETNGSRDNKEIKMKIHYLAKTVGFLCIPSCLRQGRLQAVCRFLIGRKQHAFILGQLQIDTNKILISK